MAKEKNMWFLMRFYANLKRPDHKRNKGIAVLWAAITLLVLILFMGLAIDGGRVYFAAHQLQNAADAAALAGARLVKIDQNESREQAEYIGGLNYCLGDSVALDLNAGNNPEGDIVIGWYNPGARTFTVQTEPVNALKTVAKRTSAAHGPIPFIFGRIVNVDTADVSQYAIAIAEGGTGAGLIALACDGTGLEIQGSVFVDVDNGDIQVNSASDSALDWVGQAADTDADAINIVGGYDGVLPENMADRIATDAFYLPDPLCPAKDCDSPPSSCIPEPVWGADLAPVAGEPIKITEGDYLFEPGYYSGGFDFTGGNIVLKPGVYVLGGGTDGGGGLNIRGNTNFNAQGVMFYITEGGQVDLAGTGEITIWELKYNADSSYFFDPTFSYPPGVDFTSFNGMAIYQDRNNPTPARIIGTSLMDIKGTIYFPENHLDLGGTGDGIGTQMIAWSIEIFGHGIITINYDGRNRTPANKSYLVE